MNFNVPVLFIIFARPDLTQRVFDVIKQVQPKQLFLAADGPRIDKPEQVELSKKVREITKQIDWPCEVKTLFRDKNEGCKIAISSAISWFFENVTEGIILEDDCLPTISFFNYCKELLERYRDDKRIMMISGTNVQESKRRCEASYFFSKYVQVWGWASWSRAWKHYDMDINSWPYFRDTKQLELMIDRPFEKERWLNIFNKVHSGEISSTWDYQWLYACWTQNGLTILPKLNLVSNIGFGKNATHTKDSQSKRANLSTTDMFELKHPRFVLRDKYADIHYFDTFCMQKQPNRKDKLLNKISIELGKLKCALK